MVIFHLNDACYKSLSYHLLYWIILTPFSVLKLQGFSFYIFYLTLCLRTWIQSPCLRISGNGSTYCNKKIYENYFKRYIISALLEHVLRRKEIRESPAVKKYRLQTVPECSKPHHLQSDCVAPLHNVTRLYVQFHFFSFTFWRRGLGWGFVIMKDALLPFRNWI